jgi:hypothetical protein
MDLLPYWAIIVLSAAEAAAGIYLLVTQKVIGDGDEFEIEVKAIGRLKTNFPAGILVGMGAFLLAYTVHDFTETTQKKYDSAARQSEARRSLTEIVYVSGKITRPNGPPHTGIMVGVVPGNMQPTDQDGNYRLRTVAGEGSYLGVAWDPATKVPPLMETIPITANRGTWSQSIGCLSRDGRPVQCGGSSQ